MPSLAWHAIVCPSFPVSFSTRVKYRSSICVQCPLSVPAYVSAGPTCSTQGYGERAIWASSRSGRLTARWCGSIRAERPDRSRTWHCGSADATPVSPQLLHGCVVMMPSQILGAAPGSLRAAQAPDQQVVVRNPGSTTHQGIV